MQVAQKVPTTEKIDDFFFHIVSFLVLVRKRDGQTMNLEKSIMASVDLEALNQVSKLVFQG